MGEYFNILGLPENASKAQVKRAYRKLALEYHPDRNSSPDAHERFLQITEAYEMLTGVRKRKNPFVRYYRKTYQDESFRRQTARERARQQARMQYEEFCKNNEAFRNAWYYRPTQWLVLTIYWLGWCFGIFLIISPFAVSTYIHLKGGFWWQGLFCLPLILAGLLVIHQSIRLKKEASPYFQQHSS